MALLLEFGLGMACLITGCIIFAFLRREVCGFEWWHKRQPPKFLAWCSCQWIYDVWQVSEEQILAVASVDSLMFLRFQLLLAKLCAIWGFMGCFILVPIYATAPLAYTHQNVSLLTGTDFFTLSNVPMYDQGKSHNSILWVVTFASWIFYGIAVWLLDAEYAVYIRLLHSFLRRPRPHNYTVLVRELPPHLRSNEAVTEYFKHLYRDECYSAHVIPYLPELDRLIADRKDVALQLEEAVEEWHRTKRVVMWRVEKDDGQAGAELGKLEKVPTILGCCRCRCDNRRPCCSTTEHKPKIHCLQLLLKRLNREVERMHRELEEAHESSDFLVNRDLDELAKGKGVGAALIGFVKKGIETGTHISDVEIVSKKIDQKVGEVKAEIKAIAGGVDEDEKVRGVIYPKHEVEDAGGAGEGRPSVSKMVGEGTKMVGGMVGGVVGVGVGAGMVGASLILGTNANSTAFVTFKNLVAASKAVQVRHSPYSAFETVVTPAPPAEDIRWHNLGMPHERVLTRSCLIWTATAWIWIFWAVPSATLSSISNLEAFEGEIGLEDKKKATAVAEMLSPLILILMLDVVPPLFDLLSDLEGVESDGQMQIRSFTKFVPFLIFQVFFVTCLSLTIEESLRQILDKPAMVFQILGEAVPSTSSFFIQYIITRACVSSLSELLRIPRVAEGWVRRLWSGKTWTPRSRSLPNGCGCLNFACARELSLAYVWGLTLLVWVITSIFALIAPVLVIATLLEMLIEHTIYKYQILYVYEHRKRRPVFWPIVFDACFWGLYLGQLTLIGIMILKQAWECMFLLFLPLFVLAWAQHRCNAKYRPLSESLPLEDAVDHRFDTERQHDNDIDNAHNSFAERERLRSGSTGISYGSIDVRENEKVRLRRKGSGVGARAGVASCDDDGDGSGDCILEMGPKRGDVRTSAASTASTTNSFDLLLGPMLNWSSCLQKKQDTMHELQHNQAPTPVITTADLEGMKVVFTPPGLQVGDEKISEEMQTKLQFFTEVIAHEDDDAGEVYLDERLLRVEYDTAAATV
jgi:hypothetical protein